MLFAFKINKILSDQISTVWKPYFFCAIWSCFFLFHLFINSVFLQIEELFTSHPLVYFVFEYSVLNDWELKCTARPFNLPYPLISEIRGRIWRWNNVYHGCVYKCIKFSEKQSFYGRNIEKTAYMFSYWPFYFTGTLSFQFAMIFEVWIEL